MESLGAWMDWWMDEFIGWTDGGIAAWMNGWIDEQLY